MAKLLTSHLTKLKLVMLLRFAKSLRISCVLSSHLTLALQRGEVEWVEVNSDKKEGTPLNVLLIVPTCQLKSTKT